MATGRISVMLCNLRLKKEVAVSNGLHVDNWPVLRPDGGEIYFERQTNSGSGIFAATAMGDLSRLLCQQCGKPRSIMPDGRIASVDGNRLRTINSSTGEHKAVGGEFERVPFSIAISPDGRWIAATFHGTDSPLVEGFVMPFRDPLPPKREWNPITSENFDLEFKWSVDGSSLYFLGTQLGFRDLWRIDLDSAKRPVGEARLVHAFRKYQEYPLIAGRIAVARDRVAVTVSGARSMLWRARIFDR